MQSTAMSENREREKKMGRREWYRSLAKREKEVSGCMSGVFQFLDFHNILFTPSSNSGRVAQSSSPQIRRHSSNSQFSGVEAPRNSLELDEGSAAAKASTAFAIAAEDYYGIPIGIQVNSAPLPSLKKQNKKNQGLEEDEKRDSQSQCITPRTTNLVARLMGLDVSSEDTPRASSERSRDADPRLSLQINKENVNRAGCLCEYSSLPPSPTKGYSNKPRKKEGCLKENDENRSPRSHHYARGIVKQQVKENTQRGEKTFLVEDDRNRFLKSPKPQVLPKHPQPKPATTSVLRVRDQNVETTKPTKIVAGSCKKASTEKFTDRIKKNPPLSEAATRSDSTLLSRLTLPLPSQSSSPNLAASSSQKHGLSRENMKRSYDAATSVSREDYLPASAFSAEEQRGFKDARAPKEQDPEFLYVQSILQRSGITNPAQPRRYSPSLAVDPFIFHQLELDLPMLFPRYLSHRNPIRHRSNRKLLFHLVQEVLADLLACRPRLNKANLLDRVWTQIRSFPLADCQVIEDIDALVAGDLAEAKVRRLLIHTRLVGPRRRGSALEVEEEVMDSVVGEAAASLALCSRL
ncbi:uncharacterized protein A4U43_C04F22030 [Asparagus officinalis]|uniref:DUF4378 domain-containing protein n=1 Tax=Asparagus officinalis TaxID=4686 RepID=A0A5P1F2T7_ASPOF|nr:uncharacterized protein A4U43_C04F22030 [Asparagus officinalis]